MTTTRMLNGFSDDHPTAMKLGSRIFWLAILVASFGAGSNAYAQVACTADNTITANVVVLDNPTVFNRLGAQNPNWITYALERDVVHWDDGNPNDSNNGKVCTEITGGCIAGQVQLRPDKRPRPLVVRSVAGSCLTVNFKNLLDPMPNPNNAQLNAENPAFPVLDGDPNVNCALPENADNRVCILNNNDQVAGRCAGFHASGTELVSSMSDDGSMVGANPGANIGPTDMGQSNCGPGMAAPGESRTYNLYTPHEGAFVVNSYGATIGSEQSGGNLGIGMFGALNVQPVGAKMYRSQVTEEELRLATTGYTAMGQPIIDYEALYPDEEPWKSEGKANLPVLNMLTADNELVHSDINAIIAGPNPDGTFPNSTYPLESTNTANVPSLPNRLEPFREFTSIYHDEQTNSQVFPKWYADPVLGYTLDGVGDAFMINYGSGGIGSEIIANRLHTGPMHDCTDCAYEEFFLASQTVGDPGGLVNFPANSLIESCDPSNILSADCWRQFLIPGDGNNDGVVEEGEQLAVGANPPIPGNYALYQEDPSNVHHAYTGDFTKIRNTHAGAFEQHIFHLHNHQWLFNPNDDNANYLDAQEIMPGSGHTYELVNGGVGNRNKTAGDAIFHCHFYPHFAQGMWYHIRIQDVFERGTVLAVSDAADAQNPPLFSESGDVDQDGFRDNFHTEPFALRSGQPAAGSRALPDGELPDGWPIPAIVPLPGKAMPEMPAKVTVAAVDRGDFGVLSGRRPANGVLNQGPDSSQAIIDFAEVEAGKFPGYPFWLAGNSCGEGAVDTGDPATVVCPEGTVGQRMMTPVLDMLTEAGATAGGYNPAQAGGWDGGLPRHNLRGYTSGGLSLDTQNRLDFRKIVKAAQPVYYPEYGTRLEQQAMAYHAVRNRASYANVLGDPSSTTGATWVLNGSDPVPGGPFNDPCVDDAGTYLGDGVVGEWFDGDNDQNTLGVRGGSDFHGDNPRTYKLANVQIDAVFNKVGHHYSQERIIALWEDVAPTINKQRPPEPLVMRFNTFDCGKLLHANLVPAEFEVDDFQVRTPTDIIGQHIHLPKWDLTTNDGAANGWNYEDGTLSPLMVQERIEAINNYNDLAGSSLPLTQILVDILGLKVGANAADPTADLHPDLAAAVANHIVDLSDLAPVPTLTVAQGADPGSPSLLGRMPEQHLQAAVHPFFGPGVEVNGHPEYLGARTTIQRILVDPVVNAEGVDRGLGLTFSHDHYGPSTFQQIGLYSTILAEPAGSTWKHNESGVPLGTRDDGGPTTWQAVIEPPASAPNGSTVGSEDLKDHREFYFEMSDFQHAYNPGTYVAAGEDGRPLPAEAGTKIKQIHQVVQPDPFDATVAFAPNIQDTWQETINPPLKLEAHVFPDVVTAEGACPGPLGNFDPSVPRPCAEAINIAHESIWVINYRNEPVGLRVFDPNAVGPDGQNGTQTAGPAGDLALAFQSRNDRAIPQLNTRFGDTPEGWRDEATYCQGSGTGDEINCDRNTGDPFTPIMRAYEGDEVKIKIQVGATEEQHQSTVHGIKWLSNGSGFGRSPNSGWRNFQSHGISEQFSLQAPMNPALRQAGQTVDYLYAQDATRDGIWLGTWGILRTYGNERSDLVPLADNDISKRINFTNRRDFDGVCPRTAPVKSFDIAAVLANDVLPNTLGVTIPSNAGQDSDGDGVGDNVGGPLNPDGGTLVYNRRQTNVPDAVVAEPGLPEERFTGGNGPLNDPTAMMYVLNDDLIAVVEYEAKELGMYPSCLKKKGKNGDVNFDASLPGCAEEAQLEAKGCLLNGAYKSDLATCAAMLRPGAPVEPLVLRANAGDCIDVMLRNRLVTRQAVVEATGEKVWYSDGRPVMAPIYPDDTYQLKNGAPVSMADIKFFGPPDLAGWQDMMWGVTRRVQNPGAGVDAEMYFFNNNLIRPGAYAGIHPQLVEYDASRDDGVAVGRNQPQIATPGGASTARYYAGHLEYVPVAGPNNRRNVRIDAIPVEFGASNLLSADRIKQPQKGLFGALSILPEDATVDASTMVPDGQGSGDMLRETRAQVDVYSAEGPAGSGGNFREALSIGHKTANLRWADGSAIKNIHQGELGREGAEDSGHAGFNYGMEPSWFRFQLPPDVPFGNAGTPNSFGSVPNPQAMYANKLVEGEMNTIPAIAGVSELGDTVTPVFRANPGQATRLYILNGASADRDGTFIVHGHLWQRDPYVCPLDARAGLVGLCDMDSIGSLALGTNPIGKYMGGEEGMGHVFGHWPLLFDAGGTNQVPGDYLYRDYTPSGNRNGQFGILRVGDPTP